MKTYYFTGRWEDAWECDIGCCSGREELRIEFLKLEEDGVLVEDLVWQDVVHYYTADVYIEVYEYEAGKDAPKWVQESVCGIAVPWLQRELHGLGVTVEIILEEPK